MAIYALQLSRSISDDPYMSANQLKSNLKEDSYAGFFFFFNSAFKSL